jgi:hypothetical protein
MKNAIKISKEEQDKIVIQNKIKSLEKRVIDGIIPTPTRLFKVGDAVKVGCHKNLHIAEVLFDGKGYLVHFDYLGKDYGKPIQITGHDVWDWLSVHPITSFSGGNEMRVKDAVNISFFNGNIETLLYSVYYTGFDFNPIYQRGLVWDAQQKVALIDSIFGNVDIGKFTFIQNNDLNETFQYQILDGKQRLLTICEFYEDRFSWKGKKFSELCAEDAFHFTNFSIIKGEISDITEQQIYKLFIKMNTTGTPISQKHIESIKSLIIT